MSAPIEINPLDDAQMEAFGARKVVRKRYDTWAFPGYVRTCERDTGVLIAPPPPPPPPPQSDAPPQWPLAQGAPAPYSSQPMMRTESAPANMQAIPHNFGQQFNPMTNVAPATSSNPMMRAQSASFNIAPIPHPTLQQYQPVFAMNNVALSPIEPIDRNALARIGNWVHIINSVQNNGNPRHFNDAWAWIPYTYNIYGDGGAFHATLLSMFGIDAHCFKVVDNQYMLHQTMWA